ncbi:type IV pilus secretin PilQ [Nitrincola tapanii]|nr:type IV pilus secretin PilQ [Nitrincola tapanii]
MFGRMVSVVCTLLLLSTASLALAQDVQLKRSAFVALPGQGVEVKLDFDSTPPVPNSYMIENPPRLVMDFWGVSNETGQRGLDVKTGLVDTLSFAQVDGRLRLVTNLYAPAGYKVVTENNSIFITLEDAAQGASAPVSAPVSAGPRMPVLNDGRTRVQGIDFQRIEGNQGRVTVTLTDERAGMDIFQEGGNVIVNLTGAGLSDGLERRLDVQDFATPLMFIDTMVMGENTTLLLKPSAEPFDYMAYQTGNQLVVDFKPLSRREQAELDANRFPFSGQKIDLNFQNVEVRAVLQIIAEVAEKNLVVSDNVQGGITLRLKNVPWDQALDIILKNKNLDKREAGNVIMVGTIEEIKNREMLELESIKQVEDVSPLLTDFIQIDFRRASDLKERLEAAQMISERGFVVADDQTNVLMVRETARALEDIRRTLRRFDVEVSQILVEARIVETTANDAKELGVRWGLGSRSNDSRTVVLGAGGLLTSENEANTGIPFTAPAIDLGVAGVPNAFTFGVVGSSAILAAEISALESVGRLNVISQPKVVTANGQKAVIASGQKIPYQVVEDGTTTIKFEEVDLRLDVTPQINPGDRLSLVLQINKDAIGGETRNGDLIIDRNVVETTVTVNNGETVVLGGVFIDRDLSAVDKTPVLGDLPVLGNLFKKTVNRLEKRELLIFITPTMIRESLTLQ